MSLALSLCIALAAAAPEAAGSRRITLADALRAVEAQHADVRIARARAAAALADGHAARSHLLFGIKLSDSVSLYNSRVHLSGPLFSALNPKAMGAFPTSIGANVFSVEAGQPLLGLGRMIEDTLAAYGRADASAEDARAALADTRATVKTFYLRLFEARALADTAAASVRDLDEQVGRAQSQVDAGALTVADVLRVKVAAASAKQQVIAARAQEATVRAMLLETLGYGADDDAVSFEEPTELQEVVPPAPLAASRQAAMDARPELKSAAKQVDAAHRHARAQVWALLPDITLVGSYMKIDAEPWDSARNKSVIDVGAASVGLAASWDIWQWGSSYYAHAAAAAQARVADSSLEKAQQAVGAEVAGRRADALAAANAVEVARVQVASAEEAFRVMQALTAAGSATTTDLLDAEAALTSARMTLVHARYENAVATVALRRAVGQEI